MAHFNFVISQNAKWGHAGFYIDCHRMTVPENILLQKSTDGNSKIISFKKLFHHSHLGPLKKKKNPGPWARAQCAHWLRWPCFCKQNLLLFVQPRWQRKTYFFNHYNVFVSMNFIAFTVQVKHKKNSTQILGFILTLLHFTTSHFHMFTLQRM